MFSITDMQQSPHCHKYDKCSKQQKLHFITHWETFVLPLYTHCSVARQLSASHSQAENFRNHLASSAPSRSCPNLISCSISSLFSSTDFSKRYWTTTTPSVGKSIQVKKYLPRAYSTLRTKLQFSSAVRGHRNAIPYMSRHWPVL